MLLVVVCVKVSDKTSFKNLVAHLLLTLEFVVTCLFMASCISFFFHEIIEMACSSLAYNLLLISCGYPLLGKRSTLDA